MIEAMKQAVVYFEHMVRTLKLRDESEPAQLLFKLRQAIEQAERQETNQVTLTQTNVGIVERGMEAYEAAKERGWVGLTDKEAMQICEDCGCLSEDWLVLLDAIEAKLRSKNT